MGKLYVGESMNCFYAYNGRSMVDMDGKILPCCKYTGDTPYLYEVENLDEVSNSNHFKYIQKTLNEDKWPTGCWMCKEDEEAGRESRRQYGNYLVDNNILTQDTGSTVELEISIDYTCNMMCRMCGPAASSKWGSAKSVINDFAKNDIDLFTNRTNVTYKQYQNKFIDVWNKTDLSSIESIRLIGGEPFYAKHLDKFFEKLYNSCDMSKVSLFINTNGSIFPKQELIDKLLMFKKCEISFSLDAVGSLAECLRYGISWQQIENNVQKWVQLKERSKNIILSNTATINILNFNMIDKLEKFCETYGISFWCNPLQRPKYLSIYQLEMNERIEKMNKGIGANFNQLVLANDKYEPEYKTLLKSIDILDNFQGIKFKDINPDIYEMVKNKIND